MQTTENPPQIAEQIPLTNDIPGENSPASQNSTFEKLRGAVGGIIGKYKAGRGRPRKDGQPKISDIPVEIPEKNMVPVAGVVSAPPDSAVDSLFRRSIVSGAKGILAFLKTVVRIKADAAGIDEKFISKTLNDCEPEAEDLANFSESLKIVLEKYNVKSEKAPEISLAINSAKLVAPYLLLFSTFNAEIKRRRALENNQPGQAQ